MKRKQEAARRAYEAEMKKQEEARKEAARKAHEAEIKRRRDEQAKARREAEVRAYQARVKQKWNRNAQKNAKRKVTECDTGSWNGVRLVWNNKNAFQKVPHQKLLFSKMRHYTPRGRGGDNNIKKRQLLHRTWGWGGIKLEVKTGKRRFGWRKRISSWPDTKTHISFGSGRWWRDKKTYDGHLFVDGNRLMLRKAISFGRAPWSFYLKDVEIAKFSGDKGECAIIAVSSRSTKRLLFVQSNNSEQSFDLITEQWITHPFGKCLSLDEWTQKLCKNSDGKYMC